MSSLEQKAFKKLRLAQKWPLQKKVVFYLCAQVTLRSHPVENYGIARLQTLKIAGERRVPNDVGVQP